MADSATAWITAGSTLAGVLIGQFAPIFTSYATNKRERESRREARQDAARQKQKELQRETLLALQEAVNALRKASGEMEFSAKVAQLQNGFWKANYPLKVINVAERHYHLVTQFSVRVLDETVRSASVDFQQSFQAFFLADAERQATEAMQAFLKQHKRMHALIGERLRILEDALITL